MILRLFRPLQNATAGEREKKQSGYRTATLVFGPLTRNLDVLYESGPSVERCNRCPAPSGGRLLTPLFAQV